MKHSLYFIVLLIVSNGEICYAQSPVLWGMTSSGGFSNGGIAFQFNCATHNLSEAFSLSRDQNIFESTTSFTSGGNGVLYLAEFPADHNNALVISFSLSMGPQPLFAIPNSSGGIVAGPLLIIGDSIIYGATASESSNGVGTIFRYNLNTNKITGLHDFPSFSNDGKNPSGALINTGNGMLYGVTQNGGSDDNGIIYSYNMVTGHYNVEYSFSQSLTGQVPSGALLLVNDSLLYGTTLVGGAFTQGTLYCYNVSSGIQTVLHHFNGSDGANPVGSLIMANNGLLYGVATVGGANNEGTIFSYNINSSLFLVQHDFGSFSGDGIIPDGSLIQATDGQLYGTTLQGGTNNVGTIYVFNTSSLLETVIHSFDSINGARPQGALLQTGSVPSFPTSIPPVTIPHLQISPNPTTGQFTLQLPGNQNNYMAEVYNTLGQKIEQLTLNTGQNTINLNNQPTGMYFVEVQTETGSASAKVMVER